MVALTTVATVKAWLSIPAADSSADAVLTRLIAAMSQRCLSYCSREGFGAQQFTDTYSAVGQSSLMLRQFPVISVDSLVVDNVTIPPAPPPGAPNGAGAGFLFAGWDGRPPGAPALLDLYGYGFGRGLDNVLVTYTAGYQATQAGTIPTGAGPSITAATAYGSWNTDGGVVKVSDGAAFDFVTGTTPGVGEYALDPETSGKYLFNAGDVGEAVLITFGWVPADVEQAVIEWVAERFAYRDRIGLRSKSLGGQETMAYAINDLPAFVRGSLQAYCSVALS